ncbi:MAG: tetratricopeptide repeat protein [Acidobacteriota bacterium]|nr:tetratricopeptide repeat protein [Acidobacteriota bacterium]
MQKLSRSVLPLAMLLVASAALAQRSQLELQVVDMNDAELGPVNVTVFAPTGEIVVQEATRKNGRLRIRLAPAEAPYRLLLQKEGYPDRELEVEILDGGRDRSLRAQLWDEEAARKQQAIDAFNEGIGKIQAGDAAGALPLFEQAVEIDPTIAAAHRTIAAILHNLGRLDEALEPAARYVEMEPMPPDFASMFFDIFAAAGDPRAEDAKQLAIEAGMGAELAPGIFSQGVQAVRAGDDERAIELFREAASLNPRLHQAYRNIGTIYFNDGQFEEALVELDRTLEIDPRNQEALRMKYFSFASLGNLEDSIEAGKAWIAVNPTAGRQVQFQAEQLFDQEAFGNAKLYDQSLIAWDDNHPRAHFRLGVIYRRSADSGPAREHLTRYLESAPDDEDAEDLARAHYELGILAVNASDANAAREHLSTSLEMAPEGEFADVARAALEGL